MASDETVQRIKEACDIAELIGEAVPLKKAGARFKGLCPFHAEKTPSFTVNPEMGIFHCFGCGVGGDVFSFVMKHEGLSFGEALETLAKRTGIALAPSRRGGEEDRTKAELYEIHEMAQKFFMECLMDPRKGMKARQYLEQRHIPQEMWALFGLGYAPASWRDLTGFLSSRGISQEAMVRSGLAMPKDDRVYDRFRDRVTFPILHVGGRVIAFGGRALGPTQGGKYINSPSTDIYEKSRVLYGLSQARSAIADCEEAVIMEGYLDVIMGVSAGIKNVVSPLGTALTREQASLLKRYAKRMIVVFDGDDAGAEASLRALEICLEEGLSVRVATSLPSGKDPCDVVVELGGDALKQAISKAVGLVQLRMIRSVQGHGRDVASKVAILGDLIPSVAKITNEVEISAYVSEMADRFDISETVIRAELSRFRRTGRADGASLRQGPVLDGEEMANRNLLKILLLFPHVRDPVMKALAGLPASEGTYGEILETAKTLQGTSHLWDVSTLIRQLPEPLHTHVSRLDLVPEEFPDPLASAEEFLVRIWRTQDRQRERDLKDAIEKACEDGQVSRASEMQRELMELKKGSRSFNLQMKEAWE